MSAESGPRRLSAVARYAARTLAMRGPKGTSRVFPNFVWSNERSPGGVSATGSRQSGTILERTRPAHLAGSVVMLCGVTRTLEAARRRWSAAFHIMRRCTESKVCGAPHNFDFMYQSTVRLSLLGSALAPDFVTEGRC